MRGSSFSRVVIDSAPDTLAALNVNPDTGLTHVEVDVRRTANSYYAVVSCLVVNDTVKVVMIKCSVPTAVE